MDLAQTGRQLVLGLINLDDIVLTREMSATGMNLLGSAGRSLVGLAVAGTGMATRAAVLGAQMATKSAWAASAAAKGLVPGADTAEQMLYDLDQRVGRSGEAASFAASRGVGIAKADTTAPPTDPILNQPWLEKRLPPGATWNTVLADSAAELTGVAALPLAVGAMTLDSTMRSPMGQQATRSFWESLSSIVDAMARRTNEAGTAADRSEQRALLLMIGMAPLWTATRDALQFAEGLSRAALGDGRALRAALAATLERIEASAGPAVAAESAPARLLAALDGPGASDPVQLGEIGMAMVEDSTRLARMALAYGELLTRLSAGAAQSIVNGTLDVDQIETWVRADEANRAQNGGGLPERCPASVRQLEWLVASSSGREASTLGRGFFAPSTIDLARDTVFGYSNRALGREAALARMTRLFGREESDRLRDDCSLRSDILDAGSDRDRRIAALVSSLQREGRARLRTARDHAAARLASLTSSSPDAMLERFAPLRLGERIAVLRRFVGMADTANALDGVPSAEPARQRAWARFSDWIDAPVQPSLSASEARTPIIT